MKWHNLLFQKKQEPIGTVPLKDICSKNDKLKTLERLKQIYLSCTDFPNKKDLCEKLDLEIRAVSKGYYGENNIYHHLKYSGINMYLLHDLYFKKDDLSSQIDFILITEKYIFIIESKWRKDNTIFEIKENGQIRSHPTPNNWNDSYPEDSPFTQNKNHRFVLNQIIKNDSQLNKYISDKNLLDIVVLSNPKMSAYTKKAPLELASKLVLLDNLSDYITKMNSQSHLHRLSFSQMEEIGTALLSHLSTDTEVYFKCLEEPLMLKNNNKVLTDEELTVFLKKYRSYKAKQKGFSPQYIFYNDAITDIVKYRPETLESLKTQVKGIKEKKAAEYGNDILQIVKGNIPNYLND